MKKTKRWLTVILVFYLMHYTNALRASQLFLQAKTSTTTTTSSTTEPTHSVANNDETDEVETTELLNNASTKPTLTGIPQIDYIWDPNLPRELRGYNLTEYPFFNAVPPDEEIDFKCDGLHDGFYASVKHKCQLYHHCLFGNRYDFLCANFTAFDQKTFICHFVSEIDCKSSPKYYHRNDALYMAATTTTHAPPPTTRTTTTTTTTTVAPQRRPNRPGRRPLRRKRPQYEDEYDDYYDDDDYYEERYRRRKQRPRHRRPDYEDEEYEDRRSFSDDRYDRRPYNSRNDEYDETDSGSYEGRRKYNTKPRHRNRNYNTRFDDDENFEKMKGNERRSHRNGSHHKTSPPKEIRTKSSDDVSSSNERYRNDDDRKVGGHNEKRFKQKDRRPSIHEKPDFDSREFDEKPEAPSTLVKPSVSSSSSLSSLFERPRAAPRIARPVPNNKKSRYSYNVTSTSTTTDKPVLEYEYYDDEETGQEHKEVTREIKSSSSKEVEGNEDDILESVRDDNNQEPSIKSKNEDEKMQPNRDYKPNLRTVKRPFLPSRGGSPYLPRGLQPVGSQTNDYSTESTPIDMGSTISGVRLLEHGQPILRSQVEGTTYNGPRTTLPPQSSSKLKIEDLYETEYDVTLNDALNPTLKPLSADLRRRATYPQTRGLSSQTRNQESSRHSLNYYDY